MTKVRKGMLAGALGVTALTAGGMYWKSKMAVPAYIVMRVIDGDTFETTEKQLVRLAHIDAPELGLCGGAEAKKELEKLILGQPVYFKVMYRDRFMRLISLVYTPGVFVNEKMTEAGLVVYRVEWNRTRETEKLGAAQAMAEAGKRGIYGPKCTQAVNPDRTECNIKGNVREDTKTKIYSLPGCESYGATKIQLYFGDRWFCNEAEAKKAGFAKAGGCP